MRIDHVKGQFAKLMDTICHEMSLNMLTPTWRQNIERQVERGGGGGGGSKSVSSLGLWVTFMQIRCNMYGG